MNSEYSKELNGEIKIAVNLVRSTPSPDESLKKAESLALNWADTVSYTSKQQCSGKRNKWPSLHVWTMLGSATAVAVILVIFAFWHASSPSTSWAEVIKAMQTRPWIHAATKSGAKHEIWFSQKHQIVAANNAGFIRFLDHKSHFIDQFNPAIKRLVRISEVSDKSAFTDMNMMFESILSGKPPSVFPDMSSEISEPSETKIEKNGRQFTEYRLTLRSTRGPMTVVFHVDPSTNLPTEMIFEVSYKDSVDALEKNEKIVFEFDYPEDGPADIYALGVPTSIQRIDDIPKPKLSQVLDAIAQARANFGPYEAVVIEGDRNGPAGKKLWHVTRVWRKGPRFRVESGISQKEYSTIPDIPSIPSHNLDWCRKYLDQYPYVPITVCNGKIVYETEIFPPDDKGEQKYKWLEKRRIPRNNDGISTAGQGCARNKFVELYAYPSTIGYPNAMAGYNVAIKPLGPDDPPGMIFIETWQERFLIDPARSFVTVRHEFDFPDSEAKEDEPQIMTDIYEMEDFQKSPTGIWYPTKVHRQIKHNSPSAKEKIKPEGSYYFYLDFPKDIPDDLFQPESKIQKER